MIRIPRKASLRQLRGVARSEIEDPDVAHEIDDTVCKIRAAFASSRRAHLDQTDELVRIYTQPLGEFPE